MKNKLQICWVSNLQTFTAKIYFTVFLISAAQLALAQFTDNFSDNDFTESPPWKGDDARFVISKGELKLEAPQEGGIAILSTPSLVSKDAAWEFKLKMEFNPSASNHCRIYLTADQADLNGALNGYFVTIGDRNDEVSLYRQEGNTSSKIIDGRDDILDQPAIALKIRVLRDGSGEWQLFTNVAGTEDYFLEGSVADDNAAASHYFGIRCAYTATRSDKFFFDDFNVQQGENTDETGPDVVNLEIKSSLELSLTFSELLDSISATRTDNYTISPIVGHPTEVNVGSDKKTVVLKFNTTFQENSPSVLTIKDVADQNGNVMETTDREFFFFNAVKPDPKAVIISEIFADPSPAIGLPESEFVEIFNRSQLPFNLSGWTLTDQSAVATLPNFILAPNEYVVLTSENSSLPASENLLQLRIFPSLNNSSDVLILKDADNNTIDSVSYANSWYRDEDKRDGGWTLEIIDPDNVCSERDNWSAAEDDRGGTPGIQNSVFAIKPDLAGPKLLSTIPISAVEIQLQFDEKLEKYLRADLRLNIDPPLDVTSISFTNPSLTQLRVSLAEEIQKATTYSVTVENLHDCAGNLFEPAEVGSTFGLPEAADSLEILINEVLFNPRPTGVDFVEIINTSGKFINLKDWALASTEDGILKNKMTITTEDYLLKPGDILALTENSNILMGEYRTTQKQHLLQVHDLPAFNDDFGSVVLLDTGENVIDQLDYTKDMHSVFIKDEEGVSLERISLATHSTGQNWKSASSSVGFSTPGYINSNALQESNAATEVLKVEPEIFDPLSGQNNFALIHYNFDFGGQVANVRIFDSQGRLIKELANNDIIGTTGFYRWDGDRSTGTKAPIGYYMISFETFDEKGAIQHFRAPVGIATTF